MGLKKIALRSALLFSVNVTAEELSISVHDFPPFVTVDEGRVTGVFVDIVDRVSAATKIDTKIYLYPNRRSKSVLKEGKVNANFPLGWNKERDKWLYWSLPLMSTEYGFFTRVSERDEFNEIDDFSGQKVGVFGPSNTSYSLEMLSEELEARGLEPLHIQMLPNSNGQNFRKLMDNRIDAVFHNQDTGRSQLERFNIKGVVYAFGAKKINYYIGFSKEHTDKKLVDRFNLGLEKLQSSGELGDIVRRYNLRPINENTNVR